MNNAYPYGNFPTTAMPGSFGSYPYMSQYPGPAKNEILRVNGYEGMKALDIGANGQAIALDQKEPILWFKMTDCVGYPSEIRGYKLVPMEDNNESQDKGKAELEALAKRVAELEKLTEGLA